MIISNPTELGLLIRERRTALGLTQAEFADRVGVSRFWVMDMEAGKSGAEVALVLRALRALDLRVDIRPTGDAA